MNRCASCGGVSGRDCFNEIECAEITHQIMQQQYVEGINTELLEALEEIVALDGTWSNDAYAKAETAIKKARGE